MPKESLVKGGSDEEVEEEERERACGGVRPREGAREERGGRLAAVRCALGGRDEGREH